MICLCLSSDTLTRTIREGGGTTLGSAIDGYPVDRGAGCGYRVDSGRRGETPGWGGQFMSLSRDARTRSCFRSGGRSRIGMNRVRISFRIWMGGRVVMLQRGDDYPPRTYPLVFFLVLCLARQRNTQETMLARGTPSRLSCAERIRARPCPRKGLRPPEFDHNPRR